MPNGGPTPDCVHCKLYKGDYAADTDSFCKLHKVKLASPIRAFCAGYEDPEPDENGDWLDQKLTRSNLKSDWMYVWMDWSDEDDWESKGISSTFEHYPLIPIQEYGDWTFETFLKAITNIADTKRNPDN